MLKILLTLFFVVSMVYSSMAAVTLNVTPLDGSNSLRLENVSVGLANRKEIRIQVISTDGNRYQIFQRLLEPLVNEKGIALNSLAIETAAYNNTNLSGTLYMQNPERIGLSEQHLYTSGQSGEGDSFIVGYAVRPDQINEGGRFTGRLAFVVRAVGNASQDQFILNVELESPVVQLVKVSGSRADKSISIKDTDSTKNITDFVKISFTGNNGDIKIYQEFSSWPRNISGNELNADLLQFQVIGSSTIHDHAPAVASLKRVLIYNGSGKDDEAAVYWLMDAEKVSTQDAGTYNGIVKYIIESALGTQEFTIDLECVVQPVFIMTVDIPPDGVNFGRILADGAPQEKSVDIVVNSNLHKPYQVMQGLKAAMTNQKGDLIDKKYLTMRVELPARQKGRSRFKDFSPVEIDEYPVFVSDEQGSPVSFKIIYSLRGFPEAIPGDFLAPVRLTLQEN